MGHKIQMYENLRDMLEREIGEIERRRDLNKDSLDNLFKLTGALKVVDKCIEKQEEEEMMKSGGGMSMRGQSMRGQSSYDGGSMMYPYMGSMEGRGSYEGASNNSYRGQSGQSNEGGQSGRGGSYGGSYESNQSNQSNQSNDGRRGRDGDSDGRYNESRESQDRGRSYERGYSRDAAKKKMVQKLETLMDDTMSEKERQAIRECISAIDK